MTADSYFITGTDTSVGKTVVTALLARHFRAQGIAVRAVKPLCSGGREDAELLRAAQDNALSLDEINPWHFRAPLAPWLAAQREGVRVRRVEMLAYLRRMRAGCAVLLIEGAGGLLSPLGEDFNARDLIAALRATPLVVCPNRLGAINQALLVLAALPPGAARLAQLALVSPRQPDASSCSNVEVLRQMLGAKRVHQIPWLANLNMMTERLRSPPRLNQTLDALLARS